jgi:Family of unknown function (DUF6134)
MRAAAVLFALAAGAARAATPGDGEWNFRALLDGKPIGAHRFSVSGEGDERKVVSEANFAVKVFGITAYRYRHQATEQWRGDCLTALAATTDDDGKPNKVRAEASGDALNVSTGGAPQPLKGCVMSFAYWNPAIQSQTRLLNAQTGKLEAVQVVRIGGGSIDVRGQAVAATQFRITGPAAPIDVWYSPQGEWLGLDSTVAGGRKLSYRLQ